ncbi:ABC transporter substrate-binding protein [Dongia deserti]|uniref:ABC transporter substrate-binding protein n=1 Tax=Dongia deserti TaxID=2268030 RepID=UPI000E65B321|nr:ABC transporter substrate-binding protein [Dongia deserti]
MTFNWRGFIVAAAMLLIGSSISPSFAAAQDTGDPKATVQAFYDTLEDTMKHGNELGFEGRYEKLAPVIEQTFDVPVMAKIAIGSEWTSFTADEKERMLDAFNRYMVTTYAARFKSYKGQKFQVGDVKQPAEDRSLVETKIIRSNGDPVALNYLFRPSAGGGWKIIDVYFSGAISEMARMRSDFSSTVTGGGANALIAALERKIVDIKREPGQ